MSRRQQSGFTIVEMMIATAIFSIILLIITAGVMAFSRQYMRGQTASNLQFTARQVTAQMGQDIQFGTGVEAAGPVQFKTDLTYKVGCYRIGANMYLYQIGSQVKDAQHALIMIPNHAATCSTVTLDADTLKNALDTARGARELLSQGQRLLQLNVSSVGSATHALDIVLAGGDDDLFTPTVTPSTTAWEQLKCKAQTGQEFCSVTSLHTVAVERV